LTKAILVGFTATSGAFSTSLTLGGNNVLTTADGYLLSATAASTYLTKANNLSDLANAGTARTNLGLGTAATQATGTSAGTLPFLNGTNTWSGVQTYNSDITFSSAALNWSGAASVSSATTTDIGAQTSNLVTITGTVTITSLGTAAAGKFRYVKFAAALLLTHNTTSLILPTSTNITTAANDIALFVSEGSGNWRCYHYDRADGTSLVSYLTTTSAASTYQPLNSNLTAYAGANWSAGTQIAALTAANTITLKTVGSASGNILDKTAGDGLYAPIGAALITAGTAGQQLKKNSSTNYDASWVDEFYNITYIIDGGGTTIITGLKGGFPVDIAGTITQWTLLEVGGTGSSSIQIDIWKDTYANFPPTVADTITASAKPLYSSSNKGQSSTLTGWTTAITAGDVLYFNVDSVTAAIKVCISLKVKKT
jgi:hypothetical protein